MQLILFYRRMLSLGPLLKIGRLPPWAALVLFRLRPMPLWRCRRNFPQVLPGTCNGIAVDWLVARFRHCLEHQLELVTELGPRPFGEFVAIWPVGLGHASFVAVPEDVPPQKGQPRIPAPSIVGGWRDGQGAACDLRLVRQRGQRGDSEKLHERCELGLGGWIQRRPKRAAVRVKVDAVAPVVRAASIKNDDTAKNARLGPVAHNISNAARVLRCARWQATAINSISRRWKATEPMPDKLYPSTA